MRSQARMFVLLGATLIPASATEAREVTFHKDVLPILQNRCQSCHRPGEAGPMSLLTYKDARPWAKAIREVVVDGKMPPWFADPKHGKFANERVLGQDERDTLTTWVDGGAREGNPTDAPAPRRFTEGWTIGAPDLVLEMPAEFQVPASGTVEYQFILIPGRFTEDRWVEKVEVRPGNTAVVHHLVVTVREPGAKYRSNLKPEVPFGPAEQKPPRRPDDGTGVLQNIPGTEVLGVYVPGGIAYELKPGQGRLIKAGSDLIFQIHYTTNGTAATDRSRIGLTFAKEVPNERVLNTLIANTNLRIPPGAADHRVVARVKLHETVRLVSMFPHMHLRGKSFEYRAVYPSGESEVLLSVPQYDFNWQLTYYLREPRLLPRGTVLECIAHFDNSSSNRFNPDPTQEVGWGNQTWEEMLAGFLDLGFDLNVKPDDIVGPSTAKPTQANER